MSAAEGDPGLVTAQHVDGVITKAEPVLLAIAHGRPPTTLSKEQTLKLQELAHGIREREDKLAACARIVWLENGLALLEAKKMLAHGDFEAWCEKELSYKKSTAEKMMRAARVLGPWFKSVSDTLLPPPTLAYALSAPSIPQTIRDAFVPRMVAGEMVRDEAWAAIKQHREGAKVAKAQAERSPISHLEQKEHRAARANEQAVESELSGRGAAAFSLLLSLVADGLPRLVTLLDKAGPGAIFSLGAERELKTRAQTMLALTTLIEDEKSSESASSANTADADAIDLAETGEASA